MPQWVRLCALNEAPAAGAVMEAEAAGVAVCLANVGGQLHALDNWCPHRRGSLGQGWVEGGAVVCPLHAWSFDVWSGDALPPERAHVDVLPLQVEDGEILVDIA